MLKSHMFRRQCTAAIAALVFASMTMAQSYPAKPIKLIIPFPPGGPTDAAGRLIAQKLSEGLGQQVVVDNRAGASGIPGTEAGAKAAPDGYTLTYGTTSTFSILPSLSPSLPYDPRRSFAPVSMVASGPLLVIVHASVPAQTLRDLIALAKAQPGKINFGSAGSGTVPHLAAELFKTMADVDLVHIPYKGSGPAQTDLVAGRIQVMFDASAPLLANIKAGKLRALAIASSSRLASLPDTPTAAEAGLPQIRSRPVERHIGARRHITGDRIEAERGDPQGARRARHGRGAGPLRAGSGGQFAGGVCLVHRRGDRALEQGGENLRCENGIGLRQQGPMMFCPCG